MKLSKYIFVILITAIFISGCNSIKNTLSGKKKQNTDEFLVKIKNPLILPPNYDDLPKPVKKTGEENNNNEDLDFSNILSESKVEKELIKKKDKTLERSISNILNSN
jgi:PBP1b-binding outer membrane lipoprotein LpoB|tara:strand:- start:152 stop:472 length:321 start_codon:yes stop_codon:yes gene_type:complete